MVIIMDNAIPKLPQEPIPQRAPDYVVHNTSQDDDGWEAIYDESSNNYYFYNRLTKQTTWTNPRVKEDNQQEDSELVRIMTDPKYKELSTYEKYKLYQQLKNNNKQTEDQEQEGENEEHGSPAQITAFIDKQAKNSDKSSVSPDALADPSSAMNRFSKGKSLKAERAGTKVSKQQLKVFKQRQKEKKELKKRKWLTN